MRAGRAPKSICIVPAKILLTDLLSSKGMDWVRR